MESNPQMIAWLSNLCLSAINQKILGQYPIVFPIIQFKSSHKTTRERAQTPLRFHALALIACMLACVGMTAAPNEENPGSDFGEVIEMETLSVNIGKYRWWHAKSRHFEFLICTDKSDWLVPVIQKTELLISKLAAGTPLFQLKNDLPIKIIYITDDGLDRFDKATGSRMAVREAAKTRFEQHHGANIGLVWPPSTPAQNKEQLMILKNVNHAKALGATTRMAFDSSILLRDYIDRCLYSNNIKTSLRFRSIASVQTHSRTVGFYGVLIDYGNEHFGITPFYFQKSKLFIKRYFKNAAQESIELAPNFRNEYRTGDIEAAFFKAPHLGLEEVLNTPIPFDMPPKAPVEDRARHINLHRQCADFADYCVLGPNPKAGEAFTRLLLANRKMPITEDIFKECFQTGFKEFHKEMYDFYRSLAKNDKKYKNNAWGPPSWMVAAIKREDVPAPVKFTPASRSQSARIIGEWFLLNNRPDIARRTFAEAVKVVPSVTQDPDFAAALGLFEFEHGDKTRALALLEKAAAANVVRPEAHRALSRLLLENLLKAKGEDYKLDETEVRDVAKPLLTATKQPQANPETYRQLIELMRRTEGRPPVELLETLARDCAAYFPDDFGLLAKAVPLLVQNQMPGAAAALLDATATCVLTGEEKTRLRQLRAQIMPTS